MGRIPMPKNELEKLVVFTGDPNFAVCKGIGDILDNFENISVHILLHKPERQIGRLVRNQFRNLKKHGVRWIPYQTYDIISRLSRRPEPTDDVWAKRPGNRYRLNELVSTGRVEVTPFTSVNGDAARSLLDQISPDLGISLAAPILSLAVFQIPRLGTINLHKGKLPDYRGMPPAFWEIRDNQNAVGCTIHQVEAKLDTGPIISESEVPIEKYSTPNGLRVHLDTIGNELLISAIQQMNKGEPKPRPQCGKGRTNTRPTLRLERQLLKDLAVKERTSGPKHQAKRFFFTAYSLIKETLQHVRPHRTNPTVIVLLYHRVNDELRDNVTIGIEQFDWQMNYLRRHWPVIPLRALARDEIEYSGRRPLVCITFDDGYRDNFDYAAPILLKHRLPATFFVSTNKITDQTPFEHDLKKLGRGLPNLNWDDARVMQRHGLDFGSHTANHANLAKIDLNEARTELVDSQETLRNELGQTEFLFAYPFGRKSDITPEATDLVRKTGYLCCCSAYGGTNSGNFDKFDIRRIGINYTFSLAALRSRLNGWG